MASLVWACGADPGDSSDATRTEPAGRPDILLIVADDLGWNDVGYHGSEIRTPRIDDLAAAGVRAEHFYAQPSCTATRAALLTGRYPARYGLQGLSIRPWSSEALDPAETTVAEALGGAGYATALVGKWHLGMSRAEQLPTRRGFDHHYGSYGGMVDHFAHTRMGGLDWHRDGRPAREPGYTTDLIADEAVRRVKARDPGQPLLLVVSFNAPHEPLQAPPEDVEAHAGIRDPRRRLYAAMVTRMDRAIGRVLDAFEETGRLEETLVVFLSDNGANPEAGGSNRPLRGGKRSLLEGGVRVPAVFVWPGRLPAGSIAQAPLHAVDVRPTLLAAAGVTQAEGLPLDGIDALPLLRGEPAAERDLLLNLAEDEAALRSGRLKLWVSGPLEDPLRVALFDVVADPGERDDRSGREAERTRSLLARLRSFQEVARPPIPLPTAPPPGFRAPEVWGPSP